MSNIKIYGIADSGFNRIFQQAKSLLQDEPYAKDVVITLMGGTQVFSLDGKPQPYIQLEVTEDLNMTEYLKLTTKLETLGYDIQAVELRDFIVKKE